MTDTRRRVKLYALNADRQWDDRGTGHVSSSYVDRLKGISLLVRAESDGSLLLESKIQPDTAYQKQQDTLIVWSEGDNFDLALSFQEKAGCDEIWEKICQVQGKDPSVEITQDIVEESEDERFDDMSDSAPPVELPSCELSRLEDINELISNCLSSPVRKEKLATAIENDGYIKKLLNLFHMCEDLENSEGLHYLYDIFKNIFLLNKNALFEVMFSEDTIFDVIGCLEYEPSQTSPKRHREYLRQQAKFREAIPIKNPELLSKIHQTFRVQYIQDVVLPTPSVFEDNMLSTLSSFIFFNKIEIVTLVQEDEKFLVELFQMLTDETTSELKRRDLVLFLKEFCNYSQNLQPQAKETFYKTLTNLDILPALEITLASDDPKTKTASIDILTYIVEFSPSVVRAYTLQQANNTDEDHMLLNIIMEQMICDTDPELGGAVQLMGVLRILLDPENMLASVNKSEKSDFLNFFYKHSVHILIAPLLENTVHGEPSKEDYKTVQLLGLILELLSFCVEHHTYHIKNCVLNKDLLRRILVLMKSTHKFLVLCALRFMRKLIALKDEFYNRYIIKGNLFAPVVDAFVRNNGRYNLLDSAIIEMFEFIKLEDIKTLCSHVVENYGKRLDTIEYVQTFKALKLRYDHYQDILKDREHNLDSVPSILRTSRYRRDQRQLDEEEEMWFNEDDDFEDNEAVVPATNDLLSKKLDPDLDSIGKIMDSTKTQKQTTESNGPKVNSTAIPNKQPVLNNNATSVAPAAVAVQDTKPSALFKKVRRFSFTDPPLTPVNANTDNELIPTDDDDEISIEFVDTDATFDVDLTNAIYTVDSFDDDANCIYPMLNNIESIDVPEAVEEIVVDSDTSVGSEADSTDSETDTSINSEADTSIDSETDTSINSEADTSINSETDTSINSEADTSIDSEADTSINSEIDTIEDSNILSDTETSYNINSLSDTSYITTENNTQYNPESLPAVEITNELIVLSETTCNSVTLPDSDTLMSITESFTICDITRTLTNQLLPSPSPAGAPGNDLEQTANIDEQPTFNLDVPEPIICVEITSDANMSNETDPIPNNISTTSYPVIVVETPMVKGLVDYEGDSDEDEEEGEVLTPNAKRPRLS